MDKRFTAVGVILLFVTICFSGCEILNNKPDYITVHCSALIFGRLLDENNNALEEIPVGLPITVDFIKDGGERFTLPCEITKYGDALTTTVSFKLYREQPIDARITVQGGYNTYLPTIRIQEQMLAWETVKSNVDFGGVYDWEPQFTVELQNITHL